MQHWSAWDLVLVFLMWAVMMVPAANPVILLFAEINRRRNEHQGTFVSTGQFLLGYAGSRRSYALVVHKDVEGTVNFIGKILDRAVRVKSQNFGTSSAE